jgi:putative ABC transport system permease protein
MMVFGLVLSSFFLALADGGYNEIIHQFIDSQTGEMQVHYKDYLDEPKLYKAIPKYQETMDKLIQSEDVITVAPRIRGSALAFHKQKTFGAEVMGIDFSKEFKASTLQKRITSGRFPEQGEYAVVIGRRVASVLKLKLNDEIVLISSGADGSIANDKYQVVGIIDSGSASIDDMKVYMSLDIAQEFFSLWGRVHEIVIRTKDGNIDKGNLTLSEGLVASDWKEVEKDFYKAMEADRAGDSIARFIIMLLVALGVFNTVLMSILERTKEFGVLKAIGTRPSSLVKMIVSECFFMATISIVIGGVLAFAVNTYFSIYGIALETAFEYGGFTFQYFKAAINLNSYLTPSLFIFVTALLVSFFPAMKAARITPIEAMSE